MSGNEGKVHVLYPDNYWVTPERVIQWAKDAAANGEIEGFDPATPEEALPLAIELLSDSGKVTFDWCGTRE